MTRHPKSRPRKHLLRSLYIWHRYIGLTAALFVMLLAFTGLALNHTESLEMDSTYVQSDALLNWYGIHAPENLSSYQAGDTYYTAIKQYVFQDAVLLEGITPPLVGAVQLEEYKVVATRLRLSLLDNKGNLIEHIGSAAGAPAGMKAIGMTPRGELVIDAAHGYYLTDDSFLEWKEADTVDALWSKPGSTPEPLQQSLQQAYRGTGLTLERILLDLHSGRILGQAGVLLMDAAAILFLLLAGSGIWLWSRRRKSVRAHQKKLARQGKQS